MQAAAISAATFGFATDTTDGLADIEAALSEMADILSQAIDLAFDAAMNREDDDGAARKAVHDIQREYFALSELANNYSTNDEPNSSGGVSGGANSTPGLSDGEVDLGDDGSDVGDQGLGSGPHGIPVIVDLDGDGKIEIVDRSSGSVLFDWDSDGYREKTSWVASDDAFLVLDLASDGGSGADGVIDQAHEIAFGDWTVEAEGEAPDTDLEALATLFDFNNDGQFSEQDFIDAGGAITVTREVTETDPDTGVTTTRTVTGSYQWTDFRLWQDFDQDGEVDLENGELRTLDGKAILADGVTEADADGDGIADEREIGVRAITSIGLVHLDENGNEIRYTEGENQGEADYSNEDDDITILGNTLHGSASYTYDVTGIEARDAEGNVVYDEDGNVVYADTTTVLTDQEGEVGDVSLAYYDLGWRRIDTDYGFAIEFETGEEFRYAVLEAGDAADVDLTALNLDGAFGDERANTLDATGHLKSVTIDGSDGDDIVIGGHGDDLLAGGLGADIIRGGAGHDIIFFDGDDTEVTGGEGYDVGFLTSDAAITFDLFANGFEALYGAGGDDILFTSNLADPSVGVTILGLGGNDNITGGKAADLLSGDDGNDTILGGDRGDLVIGGGGNDSLLGEAGADLVIAGDGDDQIFGGLSDDVLFGGGGADSVFGEAGDDLAFGGAGNDSIEGAGGDDLLSGGADSDTLLGGDGDDLLAGGTGADILKGGTGDDWVDGGTDAGQLWGDEGDDVAIGGDANDTAWGGTEDDILIGGAGADSLMGETGDDLLVGEEGADELFGGGGDDVAFGGDGADALSGLDGDDKMLGDAGADTLNGGAGDDYLDGGDGNDQLYGGSNDDDLVGEDGADRLEGGGGDDVLIGDARKLIDENDESQGYRDA